jgi:hypothetical protein
MSTGISTWKNLRTSATCLRQAGLEFVFRYYSASEWKRMGFTEAAALSAAGLKLAVVYEDGPLEENAGGYFTAARGTRHGRNAYQWASDIIHQPKGSAIYFAVDYDYTDTANLNGVKAYFAAVRAAIAEESGQGGSLDYKIGVYGSGKVCRLIKEANSLAEYSWLAESTGWTGYQNYRNVCDVLQAIRTGSICQLDNYEDCTGRVADFGAFGIASEGLKPKMLAALAAAAPAPAAPPAPAPAPGGKPPLRALGEHGDGDSAPALATRILANARIVLATVHSSGVTDQANARQTMNDTAAGSAAHRSSYGNAPGGTVRLEEHMLGGMLALAETFAFQVTETCGGSHSPNSRHYAGVAFDVNEINGRHVGADHPEVGAFKQACRDLGATEVLGPGDPGHSTHVHSAWPRPS